MKQLIAYMCGLVLSIVLPGCETTNPGSGSGSSATNGGLNNGGITKDGAKGEGTSSKGSVSPAAIGEKGRDGTGMEAPALHPAGSVKPSESVASAPRSKQDQLLFEGTEMYDKGDFRGAIRKLILARDAAEEGTPTKQNSFRLLAFSYCVTGQRPLCRAQFVSLVKMSPDFELTRAEAGHPLWGPVFKEVKASSGVKPVKKPQL
jgi:hypothetical protein